MSALICSCGLQLPFTDWCYLIRIGILDKISIFPCLSWLTVAYSYHIWFFHWLIWMLWVCRYENCLIFAHSDKFVFFRFLNERVSFWTRVHINKWKAMIFKYSKIHWLKDVMNSQSKVIIFKASMNGNTFPPHSQAQRGLKGNWYGYQSVVYNRGQKMAPRSFYVVICPHVMWKFMKYSQCHISTGIENNWL